MGEMETLFFGGIVSLATAIVLLLLQTLLQERRERRLERRATKERFFSYDLEKLKQVEVLLIQWRKRVEAAEPVIDVENELNDLLLVSSPSLKVQVKVLGAFTPIWDASMNVINTRFAIQGEPGITSENVVSDSRHKAAMSTLQRLMIDFIRVYRAEVLGEYERDSTDGINRTNAFVDLALAYTSDLRRLVESRLYPFLNRNRKES